MRFIVTVLLIWGGMHLYAWVRVRAYMRLDAVPAIAVAVALAALMGAPIVGMALSRAGHVGLSRVIGTAGMVWAGGFFLFFWVSAVHDLWNVLASAAGLLMPAVRALRLVGARPILVEAGLVAIITAYGMLEALHIRVEHVTIRTAKFPPSLNRVRIVQVSDIHLGPTVGRARLARILRPVRDAKPDVLVSTGDLVDAEMGELDDLAQTLGAVEAPLGKFAVTGNHEYYAGLDQALAFTRAAGFTVLSNRGVQVVKGLSIAGLDDDMARYRGSGKPWDEQSVLRQAAGGDFVLLLKHRPIVEPASIPLMDLQLSGHTHRGQIFPFTLFVLGHYEYGHGLCELSPGRYLYTSRGAGTWGPPMRFLNPPEIAVIDLVRDGD